MKPIVVIVCGLPGSGKSYFGSKLAKKIRAAYLNSDRLRKKLFEKSEYSEKEKFTVYEEMLRRSKRTLKRNKSVVLDATFYKADIRGKFVEEFKDKKQIFIIEVRADRRITRKRLNQPRPYSDANAKIYDKIERQWESIPEKHLMLQSTNININAMLVKATRYLNTGNVSRTSR